MTIGLLAATGKVTDSNLTIIPTSRTHGWGMESSGDSIIAKRATRTNIPGLSRQLTSLVWYEAFSSQDAINVAIPNIDLCRSLGSRYGHYVVPDQLTKQHYPGLRADDLHTGDRHGNGLQSTQPLLDIAT